MRILQITLISVSLMIRHILAKEDKNETSSQENTGHQAKVNANLSIKDSPINKV